MNKIAALTMPEPSAEQEPRPKKKRPEHKNSLACPKIARKAAEELRDAVVEKRPFRCDLKALQCLTKAQREMLAAKAEEAIENTSCQPIKYLQQRGMHRLFHIIPQHGFTTLYFPIDTWVLCSFGAFYFLVVDICWW